MHMSDLNNDCHVSDVDIAMAMLGRMTGLYGPGLAGVGDQDQDGATTYEDVVVAVGRLVEGAFDKTPAATAVVFGATGLQQTSDAVAAGGPWGAVNIDGAASSEDRAAIIDRYGDVVSDRDIDQHARLIVEYMGAIRHNGREAFMAEGCAPGDHLRGISSTWPPDHPRWWPPNHLWSISDSYDGDAPDGDHSTFESSTIPTGPHNVTVSAQWPANHLWYASNTWLPPRGGHKIFVSYSDDPYHETGVSRSWPPSHAADSSSTHPGPPEHETKVSRTWWPNHNFEDSSQLEMPPHHHTAFTQTWEHESDLSQSLWPPNHQRVISLGWGGGHNRGTSASYPPGHHAVVSREWPGPQPNWPPGHTLAASASWGAPPDQGEWPVFPPDHTWFTSVKQVRPPWEWVWPW
ncbi:MAG: hypothetical protein ACF8R9_03120 [Phycisphaerales bacterium JB054]